MFDFDHGTWKQRSQYCSTEKKAAAKASARLVLKQVGGAVLVRDKHPRIFLDGGTTFVEVARAMVPQITLSRVRTIRLYTTNVEVLGLCISDRSMQANTYRIDLNVIGGRLIARHHSLDGSLFRSSVLSDTHDKVFDRAFIGVSAIDSDLSLRIAPTDTLEFKKTAIERADEVIFVCDDSKFSKPNDPKLRDSQQFGYLLPSQGRLHVATEKDGKRPVRASIIIGVRKNYQERTPLKRFLKSMRDASLKVIENQRDGVIRIEWQ